MADNMVAVDIGSNGSAGTSVMRRTREAGPEGQPQRVQVSPLPVTRGLTFPSVLSGLVAALLAITAVSGLLFGQRGLYTPNPATLPAFVGQDALSLLVGLPLLLGSTWAARRGSLRGLLLWMGALFYLAYSYAYYPLSPEFNVFYLAYLAIISMCLYGLVYLLVSTDTDAVATHVSPRLPARRIGSFMMAMALLLAVKWAGMIVGDLATGIAPSHKELVVWLLDLTVALPALFWGGLWLWRRQSLAYPVAGLLLLKAAFVGVTLVVNSWLVTLWGEPLDPMVPAYAVIGLGGLAALVVFLRAITQVAEAGVGSPATPRAIPVPA